MFIAERSAYTAPVKTLDSLLATLPPDPGLQLEPTTHVATVKTCNQPELLARSLSSLVQGVNLDYVVPMVVDDSRNETDRLANQQIAHAWGAQYYAVSGEGSLVLPFANYIRETVGSKARSEHLINYLLRICTDYPAFPTMSTIGGVAGAQNVGHLVNVMHYGEQRLPRREWLSTFIDDDVLMPPNAEQIFRMIGVYHQLGRVGFIASNYLHHSGSPILLAARSFEQLLDQQATTMDVKAAQEEIDNVLRRQPTLGLRDNGSSDSRYTTPETTLVFPAGNYSLTGGEAFDVPMPIVSRCDTGYGDLLLLFKGARQLGVARVPDFTHVRFAREGNGDAYDYRADFFGRARSIIYTDVTKAMLAYAQKVGVPKQNIIDFTRVQCARQQAHLSRQIRLLRAINRLTSNTGLDQAHLDKLAWLKQATYEFATAKLKEGDTPRPDGSFLLRLVGDMITLHPELVNSAYQFGRDGHLAEYRDLKTTLVGRT